MNSDSELMRLAAAVGSHLRASQRQLVTAESCTGGWIGKAITAIPGSSQWFAGGAIVYTNRMKQRLLKVPSELIEGHGAVSEAVVRAMAEGALSELDADVAVAVSGIAGPDGGTAEKPVGTVWFAWSARKATTPSEADTQAETRLFSGDRAEVRRQTVAHALARILEL